MAAALLTLPSLAWTLSITITPIQLPPYHTARRCPLILPCGALTSIAKRGSVFGSLPGRLDSHSRVLRMWQQKPQPSSQGSGLVRQAVSKTWNPSRQSSHTIGSSTSDNSATHHCMFALDVGLCNIAQYQHQSSEGERNPPCGSLLAGNNRVWPKVLVVACTYQIQPSRSFVAIACLWVDKRISDLPKLKLKLRNPLKTLQLILQATTCNHGSAEKNRQTLQPNTRFWVSAPKRHAQILELLDNTTGNLSCHLMLDNLLNIILLIDTS